MEHPAMSKIHDISLKSSRWSDLARTLSWQEVRVALVVAMGRPPTSSRIQSPGRDMSLGQILCNSIE